MQFKKLIAGVAAVAAALGGMALGTMTVNADTDTLTVPETATPSTITLNKADDARYIEKHVYGISYRRVHRPGRECRRAS